MGQFKKNMAGQRYGFSAIVRSTGEGAVVDVDVNVRVGSGTRTAAAGTLTHKGNGNWDYLFTQAETNGTSIILDVGGTDIMGSTATFYPTIDDATLAKQEEIISAIGALVTGDATAAQQTTILNAIGDLDFGDATYTRQTAIINAIGALDFGDATATQQTAILQAISNLVMSDATAANQTGLLNAINGLDFGDATAAQQTNIRNDIAGLVIGDATAAGQTGLLNAINALNFGDASSAQQTAILSAIAGLADGDATATQQGIILDAIHAINAGDATQAKQDTIVGLLTGMDVGDATSANQTAILQAIANLSFAAGGLTPTQQDQLTGAYEKTKLLTSGGKTQINGPLSEDGQSMALVRGDTYAANSPRGAITWTPADDADWPDLTGAAGLFTVRLKSSDAKELEQEAVITNPAGPNKQVSVTLTAAQTEGLQKSEVVRDHKFDLQLTLTNQDVWTPIRGGGDLTAGGLTVFETQTRST